MEPTGPQHRTACQHCTLAQSRATYTRLARERGGSQWQQWQWWHPALTARPALCLSPFQAQPRSILPTSLWGIYLIALILTHTLLFSHSNVSEMEMLFTVLFSWAAAWCPCYIWEHTSKLAERVSAAQRYEENRGVVFKETPSLMLGMCRKTRTSPNLSPSLSMKRF